MVLGTSLGGVFLLQATLEEVGNDLIAARWHGFLLFPYLCHANITCSQTKSGEGKGICWDICEKTPSLLIQVFAELLLFWVCVAIPRDSNDGSELMISIIVSVLLLVKYFIVLNLL